MWMEQIQSVDALPALVCAAGSYALGCIATGYYLVRFRTGRDIREFESGNIGARNVGRLLGKSGFIITTLGDAAKGALAVGAAKYFTGSNLLGALAALCVVIGHIWPLTLNGRGGKGVVTAGGAMLIFDYRIVLVYGAIVALGFALTRRTTMPGLVAFLGVPFASHVFQHSPVETSVITILILLILSAHWQNIIEKFPSLALRRRGTQKTQHTKS